MDIDKSELEKLLVMAQAAHHFHEADALARGITPNPLEWAAWYAAFITQAVSQAVSVKAAPKATQPPKAFAAAGDWQ